MITVDRSSIHRGLCLIHFVNAICLDIREHTLPTAAPQDFQAHDVRHRAGREYPHSVVTRKVTSAGDNLLALARHGAAVEGYFRADPLRVRRETLEPNGHSRRGSLIPKDASFTVEVVDDEIQVTIIVEIGEGNALRNL